MAAAATPSPIETCCDMLNRVDADERWLGTTSANTNVLNVVNCIERVRPAANNTSAVTSHDVPGVRKPQAAMVRKTTIPLATTTLRNPYERRIFVVADFIARLPAK